MCHSPQTKVLDSRDSREGDAIRRRRICNVCNHRFTTRERIERALPTILKRSGSKQPFDRNKLLHSIRIACGKRPISNDHLEELVHHVETWAITRGDRKLSSEDLVKQVLDLLYPLDPVAFVRYVSVYYQFSHLNEFVQLLKEMERWQGIKLGHQRELFIGSAGEHLNLSMVKNHQMETETSEEHGEDTETSPVHAKRWAAKS